MLTALWTVVAPVLICAGIGFCWGRSSVSYDANFVSRLVMNIGAPCLIISSFNSIEISVWDFLQMARLAVSMVLGTALLGLLAIRAAGGDVYSLLPPVVFSNSGNMGMPLCLFAFGQTGLALAVSYFLVMASFHITLGILLQNRANKNPMASLKEFGRQPIIYAIIIALLLLSLDLALPTWLANTVDLIAGFTIPLMLITLGVSLSGMRTSGWRASWAYALVRVGGGFAVALLATSLFEAQGAVRDVALLQSIMPTAVFNYLFALKYNRQPETIAGIILASTCLSFITVPSLLLWLGI